MKYLYLQLLKLRVWILRRRLRRMGFQEATDRAKAQTPVRLRLETAHAPNSAIRWLRITLLIVGLVIWLIFYLRMADPVRVAVPPPRPASPCHPDAITPINRPAHSQPITLRLSCPR